MARLIVRQFTWQRVAQRLSASRAGARLLSLFLHHLDRPLMRLSGGRWAIPTLVTGLPTVALTTLGARSDQPRTVPAIGIPDGDDIILIASNWGSGRHPAWYHNLHKHPVATVAFDGHRGSYEASEVTEPAEYDRLWRKASALYVGFARYRQWAAGRRIPIVRLHPGR